MKTGVPVVVAVLLGLEAANSLLWLARIASAAPVYDATVLALAAVRALVTALQASGAVLLVRRAPPAVALARAALAASAALLVVELGFGVAPTSVPPWFRWRVVVAYAACATAAIAALGWSERHD